MKRCAKCRVAKSLSDFTPSQNGSATGRHAWCKSCCNDVQKARRHAYKRRNAGLGTDLSTDQVNRALRW